jgi:hypothetical protein
MNSLPKVAFAAVSVFAAWTASASAQSVPAGSYYSFHSAKQGGCPALDWHIVVGANGALSGMIAWDDMKAMAHAEGTVNMQAKTFQMSAKEVGGQGRTATVTGTVRNDGYLVANIQGPNVNCQGVTVPWFKASSGNG